MPSVIIPAHNEAAVIESLLTEVVATRSDYDVDVIVVANGCSDDTAQRAQKFDVRVVEISEASKARALRVGDRAARAYPRVYLDADIHIRARDLARLFDALDTGSTPCAAPTLVMDTRHSSPAVRAALALWQYLPWSTQAPIGSGVYGVSAEGHRRIAPFPDVIADDAHVAASFAIDERVTLRDAVFTVRAPRKLRALVQRRRRVRYGTAQLAAVDPIRGINVPRTRIRDILRAATHTRQPLFALTSYAIVTAASRPRIAPAHATPSSAKLTPVPNNAATIAWGQDRSSRDAHDIAPQRFTARLMNVVQSFTDPALLLHPFRILHFYGYSHVRQRKHMQLGRNLRLSPLLTLRNGERITIGDGTSIGEYSALWAGDTDGRIVIGKHCLFGPGVFLTASNYDMQPGIAMRAQAKHEADIFIGDDVWLGTHAVVTAGVTIGDGCVVGAGAVVTKSLPAGSIAVGVPARIIGSRTPSSVSVPTISGELADAN